MSGMEAIFKIKPSELETAVLKIKKWISTGSESAIEITISVKDLPENAAYWAKLQQSLEEANQGTGLVSFTVEEFEELYQTKLTE